MTAYCGAKKRQSEGACRKAAGWGTSHPGRGRCRLHGGKTPTQSKNAAEAVLEAQVRAELAKLDVVPVDDPLTELQRLAGQVLAWERAIGERVNELTSIRYSTEGGEHLRAEVALFERAMDRCATVLVAMARLNIDERLARINEEQGRIVAEVLKATLVDLGLDTEQQVFAHKRLATHLRAVSSR